MKSIDSQDLSERENYNFLIGGIVTTLSEKGVLNGAPFSYFSIVTANPPNEKILCQIGRNVFPGASTMKRILRRLECQNGRGSTKEIL